MFICIEGCDASGKATQSKLLADKLGAKLYSFPDYETPMGHLIKGHLKRYWSAKPDFDYVTKVAFVEQGLTPDTEALNAFVFQALQLTNRMEHAAEIYELLNNEQRHVVADRYWPSGWVYGQADGLDPEWLIRIQRYLPTPDLYLLLDIASEQSVERRPERRDRYEQQEGLMDRVAHLYRRLWREQSVDSDAWVVINARGSIDDTYRQIIAAVEGLQDGP